MSDVSSRNITPNSSTGDNMDYGDVENIWIQAGGNPQAAAMAAAVADTESGFNPGASRTNPDGTVSIGLWMTPQNGSPPGSTDPLASARVAVQLSNNGTNWQQWCTTWSDNNCGEDGGKYLAEGANALASLGQRLTPASYNVIGAAPTGNGTSAGAATQSSGTTTQAKTTDTTKSIAIIVIFLLAILVIYRFVRRRQGPAVEPEGLEE